MKVTRIATRKNLKSNRFTEDSWLRGKMRKHWKRGHNHTNNQIVVRSDNYTTFRLGGRAWVKIPGLDRGRRIGIPLNTTVEPTGTLRVILRGGRVESHYVVEVEETAPLRRFLYSRGVGRECPDGTCLRRAFRCTVPQLPCKHRHRLSWSLSKQEIHQW